ncbi:PH domain-containing protein [Patescibacteria group bacterium]|nr:PH domain-containing protein [Patescibacteria group bacterium]
MIATFLLAPTEKIILVLRRHRLILFMGLFKVFFLALLPLAAFIALAAWLPSFFAEQKLSLVFWYFSSLFWLLLFCWGVLVWLDWYLDLWILTDQRIIDIEQRNFFNREISECSLGKIQNITSKVRGPLATFLKYGNVEIKTANHETLLTFEQIPNPNQIQNIVLAAHQEYLKTTGARNEV